MEPSNGHHDPSGAHTDPDVVAIVYDYLKAQLELKGYNWFPDVRPQGNEQLNGLLNRSQSRSSQRNGSGRVSGDRLVNGSVGQNCSLERQIRVKILNAFNSLTSLLLTMRGERIILMCDQLSAYLPQSSPSPPYSPTSHGYMAFRSIAQEIFIEGIRWSHILTLLVFGSQLSYYHGILKGDPSFVNEIAQWLVWYISSNLLPWIQDNGGWEGILEYYNQIDLDPEGLLVIENTWKVWSKVAGACGALGILAAGYYMISGI